MFLGAVILNRPWIKLTIVNSLRRNNSSCFLKRTFFDENGECGTQHTPMAISSWMWVGTSSIITGGILRYVCLNCVVSYNFIRSFTLSVAPISTEFFFCHIWRNLDLVKGNFQIRNYSGTLRQHSSIFKQVWVHTNILVMALQLCLW